MRERNERNIESARHEARERKGESQAESENVGSFLFVRCERKPGREKGGEAALE